MTEYRCIGYPILYPKFYLSFFLLYYITRINLNIFLIYISEFLTNRQNLSRCPRHVYFGKPENLVSFVFLAASHRLPTVFSFVARILHIVIAVL